MALSIPIREPGWIGEFKAFIARGSVIDLAVGIVIGAAFTGVVNSLVRDVINPIIGLAAGGIDFSNVFFALNGQHYNTLAAARAAGAATVNLGLVHQRDHQLCYRQLRYLLGHQGTDADSLARRSHAGRTATVRGSARGNPR